MLASGLMSFNIKNDYIKKNHYKKIAYSDEPVSDNQNSPLDKSSPKNQTAETPKPQDTPPSSSYLSLPEDDFKHVKNTLKLNQSAMDPSKANLANQKLEDLAGKADNVLLKVSTVFPFTFFVHDIIIDPYKVNIINREFFWSEHIHSILVKDILDIVVETSLFFATVKIVDQGYVENTVDITYLKKSDALKVRKIIQGLVIAHRQAVDLSILHPMEIKSKTEELGKVKGIDDTEAKIQSR